MFAQNNQQKSHGYSDHSDMQQQSNVSLESLKIRVKPVPRQHSIESSAEKHHLKDPSEDLQRNQSQEKKKDKITSMFMLNSRVSFSENRMVNGARNLDFNLLREQMEKYPVLKMDFVTSLEKENSTRSMGLRGYE